MKWSVPPIYNWWLVCRPFSKIFFEQIRESSCKRGKKYNHKARTKGLSLPKAAQGSNICDPLYQQTLHHGPKQKYQITSVCPVPKAQVCVCQGGEANFLLIFPPSFLSLFLYVFPLHLPWYVLCSLMFPNNSQ